MNYEKALKQRLPGTGFWFIESVQYKKWKADPASFLWINGIPGCGKTVLTSTILQHMFHYCENAPGKAVSYFYFDFSDLQKRAPEPMVRSLVSQFSEQCVNVPTVFEILLTSQELGERYQTLESFLQLLRRIIEQFSHTYIILDALDECDRQEELMDVLKSMVGWGYEKLHILVTSHRQRDIESSLECFVEQLSIICLQGPLVDNDIHLYVRQRLLEDKNLWKWQKDEDMQERIEDSLIKGSRGMCEPLFLGL